MKTDNAKPNNLKIIIRKAVPGDEIGVAAFAAESMKKKFFVYTDSITPPSKERLARARKEYTSKNKHICRLVAVDKSTDKIVGQAGFKGSEKGRTRHRVELGWSVHHAYAGKGIGTMLLKVLIQEAIKRGVKKMEAEAAVANVASVKLAKKFGFKVEGVKKRGLLLDNGKYADTYMFGKILG